MAFCENCGSPMADDAKFCGNCGAPRMEAESQVESSPSLSQPGQLFFSDSQQPRPSADSQPQPQFSQPQYTTGGQPQTDFTAGSTPQYTTGGQPQADFNMSSQPQYTTGSQPQPQYSAGSQPQNSIPPYGGGASYGTGGGTGYGAARMVPGPGFMDAVKICFSKYVTFDGRARRSEYWYFYLFNFLVMMVLGIIGNLIFGPPEYAKLNILQSLYALAIFLPNLAAGCRRLHDTGKPGWWLLIALVPCVGFIVLLIFLCTDSVPGDNEYGPSPKYPTV